MGVTVMGRDEMSVPVTPNDVFIDRLDIPLSPRQTQPGNL